jgi:hypothetical protein
MTHKFLWIVLMLLIISGTLAAAQETCGTESGEGCAPDSQRVDLAEPTFSNPTTITNPLFPISHLARVLFFGTVDGLPFRTETTLLPDTKTVSWNGHVTEVLVSQYMAFRDGRLEEVAIDRYAQADDGAVWYLGEDVADYKDGVVFSTEGTWLAGQDAPPAMIMPAIPQVGNVFRPENAPGIVFEEVTVKAIGQTVRGSSGAIEGAIIVEELHADDTREDKIFAPGYGEFHTGSGSNLEAVALAMPADALPGPMPAELSTLSSGASDLFTAAGSGDWNAVSASLDAILAAWDAYRIGDVPAPLESSMSLALADLVAAVNAHQSIESRQAAINVARSGFDLQLRYRPVVEIDFGLFDLWAAQILVDAAADNPGGVTNDVTTLEWVWDRIAHALDSANASAIKAQLGDLRAAADANDLSAATASAEQLRAILAGIAPAS